MKKLTSRQLNERIFHDAWARQISPKEIFFKEAFESPTAVENRYVLAALGGIKYKHILDLGCGLGDASIYFAKKNANVTAIDISSAMIAFVKKIAGRLGLSKKIKTYTMEAENLIFPDSTFEFVYGNGVLHHIDFLKGAQEIKRVLKRNGKGIFIEPLSYNPIINIYRKLAKKVRTQDEKPLSLFDINNFCSYFRKSHHKEFHLFTQLIFIWFFLGERINPNRERYWKKILLEGYKYSKIFKILYKLDEIILRFIPFLSRFCWNTVIVVEKQI